MWYKLYLCRFYISLNCRKTSVASSLININYHPLPAVSTCWLHKQNSYQSSRKLRRTYQQSAGIITIFFLWRWQKELSCQQYQQTSSYKNVLDTILDKLCWNYFFYYVIIGVVTFVLSKQGTELVSKSAIENGRILLPILKFEYDFV